ncbi:uncharacterized mitochondrial protein-like protein [Tanacetum coccineum]
MNHQSPRGIFINQAKYAQEILKKHGMTSCDSIGTPMATKHLDADLSGTPVDQTKYHSIVRALMYLTTSRPDIVHATCYCASYQAKPTEKHLTAVKRIFWYLKDSISIGGDKISQLGPSKKQDCTSSPSAEPKHSHLDHPRSMHSDQASMSDITSKGTGLSILSDDSFEMFDSHMNRSSAIESASDPSNINSGSTATASRITKTINAQIESRAKKRSNYKSH